MCRPDSFAAAAALETACATLRHLALNLDDELDLMGRNAVEVLASEVERVRDDLRDLDLRPAD